MLTLLRLHVFVATLTPFCSQVLGDQRVQRALLASVQGAGARVLQRRAGRGFVRAAQLCERRVPVELGGSAAERQGGRRVARGMPHRLRDEDAPREQFISRHTHCLA